MKELFSEEPIWLSAILISSVISLRIALGL